MRLRARLRLTRQPDGMSLWLGIAILLAGIVLVVSVWHREGPWKDFSFEIGGAAVVGGIVVLFKPRLMRQVREGAKEEATTTAEAVAMSRTEGLEERLVRLEGVSALQAEALARRRAAAERVVRAVGDSISFSNIFELLNRASAQGLFTDRTFLATSTELGQPLLEVSTVPLAREDQLMSSGPLIFLRLFVPVMVDDEGERFSNAEGGELIWEPEDAFSTILDRIYDTYLRLNLPHEPLRLNLSFASLMINYDLMFNARQESQGSTKRLIGKLLFAINDEWVLTNAGLEGRKSGHSYGWYDEYGQRYPYLRYPDSCPPECSPDLWNEAAYFARRLGSLHAK